MGMGDGVDESAVANQSVAESAGRVRVPVCGLIGMGSREFVGGGSVESKKKLSIVIKLLEFDYNNL